MHKTNWFYDIIQRVFGSCEKPVESGEIALAHGSHTVLIPIAHHGKRIWLSVEENHRIPVCCGSEANVVGAKFVKLADHECHRHGHHGFMLTADIKTDTCIIHWVVEC
jgi:hypothetical protein